MPDDDQQHQPPEDAPEEDVPPEDVEITCSGGIMLPPIGLHSGP